MFTGLVAGLGRLSSPRPRGSGLTLAVEHDLAGEPVAPGESIAVDGCCLTATDPRPGRFLADLSPETLARTGGRTRWRSGRTVHLERALTAGDRLGGHVVQGHVDGLLRVLAARPASGGFLTLRLELPAAGRGLVVEKGSVALDGVSLTVSALGATWFEVALIPATLAGTTLGGRRTGDGMIVEWDVMARVAAAAARSK